MNRIDLSLRSLTPCMLLLGRVPPVRVPESRGLEWSPAWAVNLAPSMTGFLDEYEDVIMDRGRVRRHYIGSWFMLDLPASLPYIFVSRFMPEKTPLGVLIM